MASEKDHQPGPILAYYCFKEVILSRGGKTSKCKADFEIYLWFKYIHGPGYFRTACVKNKHPSCGDGMCQSYS